MGHTAPTQVEGSRIQNPMGLAYSFVPAHCKYFPLPKIQLFTSLKVRQTRNDFFKQTLLPKNECTNWFFSTCRLVFVGFLEEIEDTKKTFRNYLTFKDIKYFHYAGNYPLVVFTALPLHVDFIHLQCSDAAQDN